MSEVPKSSRPIRSGRFTRRLLVAILCTVGGVAIAIPLIYHRLTDSERIRRAAELYLQRYTTGLVRVGSASFSWDEGIRLHDVRVLASDADEESLLAGSPAKRSRLSSTVDSGEPTRNTYCTASEVAIEPSLTSVLLGGLGIESITAVHPHCTIVREGDHTTHLTGLLRKELFANSKHRTVTLPRIELREANLRVVDHSDHGERIVDDITLDVRGRADDQDPLLYDVVWQREGDASAGGYTQIDLPAGKFRNVSGGLPWMSLEAVMIAVNAELGESGSWADLLGLEGTVRASDYRFSTDPAQERSVTIELENASLSIPADEYENELPADQRYLRFDRVNGTLTVSDKRAEARFHGMFHDSRCEVVATLVGGGGQLKSLDDVAVDVQLTLRDAELPTLDARVDVSQARFLDRFPPVGEFICDYDPHGFIDLDLNVAKELGADAPFEVRNLLLTAHGGDALPRWFPYRVYDITGTIEMTPDGVVVPLLRGTRNGSEIEFSAWLSDSTRCAEGIMRVKARDVPADDDLLAALPDRYEQICRTFHLGGMFSADLELTRERCEDIMQPKDWHGATRLVLREGNAQYEHLPYRVEDISGNIAIENDMLLLENVRGRSGSARLALNGTAPVSDDASGQTDLLLSAIDLPIDQKLLEALPEEARTRIAGVVQGGTIDLDARIFYDAESGSPSYDAGITLNNTRLRLPQWPAEVHGVSGSLHLSPTTLTLHHVTGVTDKARITADGRWSYGLPAGAVDLNVSAAGLRPSDETLAAMPASLTERLHGWNSNGPMDIRLQLERKRGGDAVRLARAEVDLHAATLRNAALPLPLEDAIGTIRLDAKGVSAQNLTGRWGGASVRASLALGGNESGAHGELELHASNLGLGSALRDALPEAFRSRWDQLQPAGTADIHLNRVKLVRPNGAKRWTTEVDARVDLGGVSLVERGVRDAFGALTIHGSLHDADGSTSLSGDLQLEALSLFGQRVKDLHTDWSLGRLPGGSGRLDFKNTEASLYDGRIGGQGYLDFTGASPSYGTSMTLREVQIAPMIKSLTEDTDRPADKKPPTRGRLDARVHVSGTLGDPLSLRGGGSVEIRDGYLYRLPVILAILQVINLTPPQDDVFDGAFADFYIVGRRVQLANVELRSKALMLTGSGELSIPDKGLDLNLIHTNPNRWTRLPVLTDLMEGASREFVELKVTGPLSRPTVRARALPGLVDELGQLFQRRESPIIRPAG
ncbi:MAG: hypothetical protein J5J06_18595 [Phycisphaerae bacterium]|nr:hypothetical protein [Phycisphaerae bacterium]